MIFNQRLPYSMNKVDAGRDRATPQKVAAAEWAKEEASLKKMVKEEASFNEDQRAHVTAGARRSADGARLRWATYESESDTSLACFRLRPSSFGGRGAGDSFGGRGAGDE
jgi:hypothetical protein